MDRASCLTARSDRTQLLSFLLFNPHRKADPSAFLPNPPSLSNTPSPTLNRSIHPIARFHPQHPSLSIYPELATTIDIPASLSPNTNTPFLPPHQKTGTPPQDLLYYASTAFSHGFGVGRSFLCIVSLTRRFSHQSMRDLDIN